jgi:hypothetical protein
VLVCAEADGEAAKHARAILETNVVILEMLNVPPEKINTKLAVRARRERKRSKPSKKD